MSFDNNYPHRKDHRKPYRRSQRFDRSCRPGGTCPYCIGSRTHNDLVRRTIAEEQLREASDEIS